jgi:hypothetical protein
MTRRIEVSAQSLRNGADYTTSTHACGGGEWSIELHFSDGSSVEFVGSNGTHGEPDDLWKEVSDAIKAAEAYNKVFHGGGYTAK